jgi:hypothetical protein
LQRRHAQATKIDQGRALARSSGVLRCGCA